VTWILVLLSILGTDETKILLELFGYQWIMLCASTSLTLLLLLFNLARGLWILYSGKTGRWSMRVQHLDNGSSAGSGPTNFKEALRRLSQALFGRYLLRKRFK